jgi:hypothetical protein
LCFPTLSTGTSRKDGARDLCRDIWRDILTRGGRGNFFSVVALGLGAFPYLNLLRLIHFSEEERASAKGTLTKQQAREIRLAVGVIRIAVTVAEDAIAIAPLTLVERLPLSRCRYLKHDSPHGLMVEITQRKEQHLGMVVHGSSRGGIRPGQSRWSERVETRPGRARITGDRAAIDDRDPRLEPAIEINDGN